MTTWRYKLHEYSDIVFFGCFLYRAGWLLTPEGIFNYFENFQKYQLEWEIFRELVQENEGEIDPVDEFIEEFNRRADTTKKTKN